MTLAEIEKLTVEALEASFDRDAMKKAQELCKPAREQCLSFWHSAKPLQRTCEDLSLPELPGDCKLVGRVPL